MENKVLLAPRDRAFKKRKSRIKAKSRIGVRISHQTYSFVFDYAIKNRLYIEEAADEIMRLGLQKVHFPDGVPRREGLLSRGLQLLRGQFRPKFTALPLSRPKLKIRDARNRVLTEKPGED